MYVAGQSEVIFIKGQVLKATELAAVYEPVSGINLDPGGSSIMSLMSYVGFQSFLLCKNRRKTTIIG